MKFGTAHFVSLADARRYYRVYAASAYNNRQDVAAMLRNGEIHVGPPPVNRAAGERLTVIAGEGRYAIETPADKGVGG